MKLVSSRGDVGVGLGERERARGANQRVVCQVDANWIVGKIVTNEEGGEFNKA